MIDSDSEEYAKQLKEDAESRIKKATALMLMKNTEGWEILVNSFEDMKLQQLQHLAKANPGDEKTVLAAHAVWYSVVHTLNEVVNAVDRAIRDGVEAKQSLDQLNNTENDWS